MEVVAGAQAAESRPWQIAGVEEEEEEGGRGRVGILVYHRGAGGPFSLLKTRQLQPRPSSAFAESREVRRAADWL
jgi:hypothetical protein